jgi:lipoprotein LpqH
VRSAAKVLLEHMLKGRGKIFRSRGTSMKHRSVISVAGGAILVAALAGCAGNPLSNIGTLFPHAASAAGTQALGQVRLTVGGEDQNAPNDAECGPTLDGGFQLDEKSNGQLHSWLVTLTSGDSPKVRTVILSDQPVVGAPPKYWLHYDSNTRDGNAAAAKDGNSYKISGNAPGVLNQQKLTPFEIDVTCP